MAFRAATGTLARRDSFRRFLIFGLLPILGVLAAACGSSGGNGATTSTSGTTASAATAPSTGSALVTAKIVGSFGKILVNSEGQVLYSFTKDGDAVPCSASCLAVWPALTLPAGVTTPKGGPGVGALATTTSNGPIQVTVDGLPLYTYAGDSAPGVANGNNLVSFGGTWKVVKAQ